MNRIVYLTTIIGALFCAVSSSHAETWAGHHYVSGEQQVPFLGKITTRTDAWVLARVKKSNGRFVLEQTTCKLQFDQQSRVKVSIAPHAVRAIPVSKMTFVRNADGSYLADGWRSGWDQKDYDRDGSGGIRLKIDAPLCHGYLHVASASINRSSGSFSDQYTGSNSSTPNAAAPNKATMTRSESQIFSGQVYTQVQQQILRAEGLCLKLTANDATEVLQGAFSYIPVPDQVTCDSLSSGPWPITAN